MSDVQPCDIIDRGEDSAFLRAFIASARTDEVKLENEFRVASEVNLAQKLSKLSTETEQAATETTTALRESARAARFHSWALVAATIVLALATIALVVVTARSGI